MTPQAKLTLGILIFQDFCVVPVMLLIPVLADWEHSTLLKLLEVLGISALAVAAIVLAARFLIPPFLRLVVGTRTGGLPDRRPPGGPGTAFASSVAGLSLALGAFIAGLVVSESEYGLQVLSDILPFRDSLNCLFFVSIGMLMDLRFFVQNAAALSIFLLLLLA